MNFVDIAIIAIIAFFALIGLWKGFGKTCIKLFCFALALLATWLVVDTVVNWVLGVEFLKNFIVNQDGFSLYSLYYNSFDSEILNAGAGTELSGVMGLYINPMIERFTSMGGPTAFGLTYAQFIAVNLSINTLSIVLCVLIYAVARIVASIIAWILKKLFLRGEIKAWSRLVGFIFGAVRGAVVVAVLLIVSTVVFPLSFAQTYTDAASDGIIGEFAAEYTYKAFDAAIYGNDTDKTENLLESAGYEKGVYPSADEVQLSNAKADALNEIDAYYNAKDKTLYSDTGKTNLEANRQSGETAINAADTVDGVSKALNDAKTAIDNVLTSAQEQELLDAKTAKGNQLMALRNEKIGENDEYDAATSAYSETNFNAIKVIYADGVIAVNNAKTVAEVNSVYDIAAEKINAVKTKLDEVREEKNNALDAAYLSRNVEGLDNEQKSALLAAYNSGKAAIGAATTVEEVNAGYNNALASMNAIYNPDETPEP